MVSDMEGDKFVQHIISPWDFTMIVNLVIITDGFSLLDLSAPS